MRTRVVPRISIEFHNLTDVIKLAGEKDRLREGRREGAMGERERGRRETERDRESKREREMEKERKRGRCRQANGQ